VTKNSLLRLETPLGGSNQELTAAKLEWREHERIADNPSARDGRYLTTDYIDSFRKLTAEDFPAAKFSEKETAYLVPRRLDQRHRRRMPG